MNNIALKYRPNSFKDLVGQDILVRILKNAFTLNRVPQSILLSGNSGIGKTSVARIIALCLNCSLGPTFEPCGLCVNCLAIKNSSHPDVVEIDAASHTSVEDIKVVLCDTYYLPVSSKFKVYIIDEVHMLSNSAFNALLKTLEEPPSSVKFIFATTEIKKVPVTITTRCQRFDLYNIPTDKIVKRLSDIAKKENFLLEKEASELIARHCNNSMRNALFLLNQAALYTKDSVISTQSLSDILGLVDKNVIFDLLEAILDSDLHEALSVFDKVVRMSNSINIFEDLLQVIQLICRFLITKKTDSLITELEERRIKYLCERRSLIFFYRLWKVLLNGIQDVKISTCNEVAAEMILISLCYLSDLPSPEQLIKKVLSQEKQKVSSPYIEDKGQKNFDFNKVLQLLKDDNQIYLYKLLCSNLQLIDCKLGYLKLKALSSFDKSFPDNLKNYLSQATKKEWVVAVDTSFVDTEISNSDYLPEVKDILDMFDGARVVSVENRE